MVTYLALVNFDRAIGIRGFQESLNFPPDGHVQFLELRVQKSSHFLF